MRIDQRFHVPVRGGGFSLLTGVVALATLVGAAAARAPAAPLQQAVQDLVIHNAVVVDGTGAPAFPGGVRIRGDRILEVGAVRPADEDRVVDAGGRVLAPGFIDSHSHHDGGLAEEPAALGAVSQGITTIVVGQDGRSEVPVADFFRRLERSRAAVNVASFAGHNTLRLAVLGEDPNRRATADEVRAMEELLREELAAGALGLSTGLEYDPGIHASTDEVVALARVAALAGGRYISHVRSEDRALFEALEEAIRVGREAGVPVHISHLKLAMRGLWGRAGDVLQRLDRARAGGVELSADVYPYTAWQSTMTVLFPDRDFTDLEAARFAVSEAVTPEGLLLTQFAPDPGLEGRTLASISESRGTEPARTLLDLIAESQAARESGGEGEESVIGESMAEEDVVALLRWPHTNVSSDGGLRGGHPRGYGAFPRVLGRYVREMEVLALEEAIYRMTGLTARNLGIRDRGTIRPGAAADLVLFDPDRVRDRATFQEPRIPSEGIEAVWVNGVEVFREGRVTGSLPGRVLRRGSAGAPGLDPATEARIDSLFSEFDRPDHPGCAVGVVDGGGLGAAGGRGPGSVEGRGLGIVDGGGLAFARGYGMANLEHGVPLGPGSVFRMASVSKQFTAALALLLERDGRLSLDDPVRTHIPELPDYGVPVTVRQLLHHTSGLRDYLALMALAGRGDDDVYDDEEVVRMVARQRELNFPAGEDHLYSNSGYFLISQLVRRTDGRTMAEYARDELLRPLGMYRSHFHDDHTRVVPGRAEGYAPREDADAAPDEDADTPPDQADAAGDGGRAARGVDAFRTSRTQLDMVGDGGLFTSLEELARWEALMQGALGEDHPMAFLPERLLKRGVLATGDTIDYALGLVHGRHRGLPAVAHGGSFVGYRTFVLRLPEQRVSVQVLCNVASARPGELAAQVAEVLLGDVMAPVPEEEMESAQETGPSQETESAAEAGPAEEAENPWSPGIELLESLAGDYWSDELEVTYRIQLEGDSLTLVEPRSLRGRLVPVEPDLFRRGNIGFEFRRDADGTVRDLRVGFGRATGIRFEPEPSTSERRSR